MCGRGSDWERVCVCVGGGSDRERVCRRGRDWGRVCGRGRIPSLN